MIKDINSELKKEDFMDLDLLAIKNYAEEISGNWNGEDESGEERAQIANDIIENVEELRSLLKELDEF